MLQGLSGAATPATREVFFQVVQVRRNTVEPVRVLFRIAKVYAGANAANYIPHQDGTFADELIVAVN
ncbi:MAG: hypothetical protein EOO15_13565 [Chitinophagaceae bacterium]|nr:MAG: hypothetical protein EOO15_13565 [Chitinophagaceae bacterium]